MGIKRISDRALYVVTVARVDPDTGDEWAYPELLSEASSVRGALTDALLAPLSRWHAIDKDENGKR